MLDNIIKQTDSYKPSHGNLYVPRTSKIHSYCESRGGKYPKTVFFGLQYYLMKYLAGVQVTAEKIEAADRFWTAHLGPGVFDRSKWEYILKTHDGKLPIRIEALPEGFVSPVSTALFNIENTDPHCFWLTNHCETLLMKTWYPITIATQSYHIKKDVLKALERSGTPSMIDFKVHDFGYRGVSSEETAAIGGAAHLLSFMGSDTAAGLDFLMEYYSAQMPGFSIPATEHSIMCSFGNAEHEIQAMENVLAKYPKGLVACVSDTWDIFHACSQHWGTTLKEKVLSRDGTLVIRPDSGDPYEVVPKCLDILWEKFGGTYVKGYKVLDPHVRMIQGDGMNPESIPLLYNVIMHRGFSADNLAVGSGGGLLQTVNRDTQKFAIKASAALVGNEWIDIYKEPITDPGKKSKKGRLTTIIRDNQVYTVQQSYNMPGARNAMVPVFENGEILRKWSLNDIKETIAASEKYN